MADHETAHQDMVNMMYKLDDMINGVQRIMDLEKTIKQDEKVIAEMKVVRSRIKKTTKAYQSSSWFAGGFAIGVITGGLTVLLAVWSTTTTSS